MMKFWIAFICIISALSLFKIADCAKPTTHRRLYNSGKGEIQIGDRIVLGTEVKENKLPYQAALLLANTTTEKYFICGGSIIDAKWVLTAAHCLEGIDDATIRVGSNKFSTGGQELHSTKFIIHSQYNVQGTLVNDIALINLTATPITMTKQTVRPIRLATRKQSCSTSRSLIVSGYGKTSDLSGTSEVLMQTTLDEVPTYDCVTVFGIDSVPSTTICAKGNNGEDSCQGDSGGPLVSAQRLVGIVSYGGESCESGMVGVYTRVGSYLDWIRKQTGIAFE